MNAVRPITARAVGTAGLRRQLGSAKPAAPIVVSFADVHQATAAEGLAVRRRQWLAGQAARRQAMAAREHDRHLLAMQVAHASGDPIAFAEAARVVAAAGRTVRQPSPRTLKFDDGAAPTDPQATPEPPADAPKADPAEQARDRQLMTNLKAWQTRMMARDRSKWTQDDWANFKNIASLVGQLQKKIGPASQFEADQWSRVEPAARRAVTEELARGNRQPSRH